VCGGVHQESGVHDGFGISRRQVLISGGLAAWAPLLSGTRNAPSLLRRGRQKKNSFEN